MAYTKESLNRLFGYVLSDLDISEQMFKNAKTEYEALGKWISATSKFSASIYPQGSFALGTVVKPISGKDDYDLDLVCELDEQYGLTARELKLDVVGPMLRNYRKIIHMENKRRCWHVEYVDVPNFHMDVIPAYDSNLKSIMITEHDEDNDKYFYTGSNPKGYADWFYDRCKGQWNLLFTRFSEDMKNKGCDVDIENLDRSTIKTPLQRTIQLLKRHRDVVFKDLPEEKRKEKPISIIITTIAAQLYNNEDNVCDALNSFLDGAIEYIDINKENGKYFIENPSYPGENFADKWNVCPERAEAFVSWIERAKKELSLSALQSLDRVSMGMRIRDSFGDDTGKRVFTSLGLDTSAGVQSGEIKVDPSTGSLSRSGKIEVNRNHHYHG